MNIIWHLIIRPTQAKQRQLVGEDFFGGKVPVVISHKPQVVGQEPRGISYSFDEMNCNLKMTGGWA